MEAQVNSGLLQGQGHWQQQSWEAQCAGESPFGEGHHCPYHSLASAQTTGMEHNPTHQQKVRFKIYWTQSYPPEQDPVFPMASSSHQEAYTRLLSSSIRGQTEWKPQSQKRYYTKHKIVKLRSLGSLRIMANVLEQLFICKGPDSKHFRISATITKCCCVPQKQP